MRMILRPRHPLFVLCCAVACGGDPEEGPTSSAATNPGGSGDASVTDGVTLNPTTPDDDDSSAGDSAAATTADPSAEDSGTADGGSGAETDGESGPGSDDSSGGSDTGPAVDDSIYDIQDGTIPEGTEVSVAGVVVTGVASNGLFVQEPGGGQFSGVLVISLGVPDISGAAVGDIVDLTGVTFEYMGITEVDMAMGSFEIVGSGPPPVAEVVDAAELADVRTAEPWECVLVRVEGDLAVVDLAVSNEFVVDTGEHQVRVDDYLYEAPTSGDFVGLGVGATFTAIQGPLNYFNDQFKIAVRDSDDLEGYVAP